MLSAITNAAPRSFFQHMTFNRGVTFKSAVSVRTTSTAHRRFSSSSSYCAPLSRFSWTSHPSTPPQKTAKEENCIPKKTDDKIKKAIPKEVDDDDGLIDIRSKLTKKIPE